MDEDTEMAGAGEPGLLGVTHLHLSEDERRVLELYDRLLELQLEAALLRAQQEYEPDGSSQVTEEDIKQAQEKLLDTRAGYVLRNGAVDNVLTANPILKAVHNSTQASSIERDLLPYVEERDATSITVAKQSTELQRIHGELTRVESESVRIGRKNVELAAEMLQLAGEAERNKTKPVDDPETRQEIARLEQQVKASRQKWRIMKGTASAVVAGSGVDWVRDPQLREMVLDPE